MTNKKRRLNSIFFISTLFAGSFVNGAVLTFEISGSTNGVILDESYGDRITSTTDGTFSYGATGGFTPNIEVSYNDASDLSTWATGYSDLTDVAYFETDGAPGFTITLTADPGFAVVLNSFDLGNFGTAVTLPNLQVLNGRNGSEFLQNNVALPASTEPATAFSFTNALSAPILTIQINTTGLGGNSDNVGIDNITFSQVAIPEPSSAILTFPNKVQHCL